MNPTPAHIVLEAMGGPRAVSFLVRADRPTTIGRAADSDICLLDDSVSRRHASILHRGGLWFVAHYGARSVTTLNGVTLAPAQPMALGDGDILRIGPWTFRVEFGERAAPPQPVAAPVDAAPAAPDRAERVESVSTGRLASAADQRLRLLTDCIERFSASPDERTLAAAALDAALAGSGYARGAVLRPLGPGLGEEILATARARADDAEPFAFSRSLLERAVEGEAVVLTRGVEPVWSQSIAELQIHSALCAPVFLGRSLVAYLYLDARGHESHVRADGAGFCEAVARAYGLMLAEVKRADLERRQAEIAAELQIAREFQQRILPAPEAELGLLRYAVEMRPGLLVAGDLFDVIPLTDGRIAVCLGDAAGHGAGSAMLMALTQAFLHAELRRERDPAAAVSSANRYLSERAVSGRFVSLWVGVFGPRGEATIVDAGHGHWLLERDGTLAECAAATRGIPLGIDGRFEYAAHTLRLSRGDRVVVYSDGVVEQRDPRGEMFGIERLAGALPLVPSPRAAVEGIFAALCAFAGRTALDDDATLALLEWRA